MRTRIGNWLVVLVSVGTLAYALAEDLTLTTYYPSPRGVYQELRATETLAIGGQRPTDSDNQPILHRLVVAGSPATNPTMVGGTTGPCPSGTAWYDENADRALDDQECKPAGLLVTMEGRVGIGTTQPGAPLAVAGDVFLPVRGTGLRLVDVDSPVGNPTCHNLYIKTDGTLLPVSVACADPPGGQTYQAYRDSDGDGHTIGELQTIQGDPFLPAGWKTTRSSPDDCDDGDPTKYALYTRYPDPDNDGHTTPDAVATQVCGEPAPATGWTASHDGTDCAPTDGSQWQLLACYPDSDNDVWTLAGVVTVCRGISCESLGGYRTSRTTPSDCDDGNNNVHPEQNAFFSSPRSSGSYDYNCDGEETRNPEWTCLDSYTTTSSEEVLGVWPTGPCYRGTVPGGTGGFTSSTVPSCGAGGGWRVCHAYTGPSCYSGSSTIIATGGTSCTSPCPSSGNSWLLEYRTGWATVDCR